MIEITHAGDQAYTYRICPTDPCVVERKSNRAYARWVKHLTCTTPTMATKTVLALSAVASDSVTDADGDRAERRGEGEMKMSELLPCPFCGGKARVIYFSESYFVQCTNGTCEGSTKHNRKEDRAIAIWNRRAAPISPAPEGQLEIIASH